MESTNLEIFIITLVAALVASFIGFIAKSIFEKYFSIVPKIKISILGKGFGGHSNFDNNISSPMYFIENKILRGFESEDRFITHEKLIDKEKITDRNKILSDFMPSEIGNLTFLLTFENEKQKKLYSEFKNGEARTYKRRKTINSTNPSAFCLSNCASLLPAPCRTIFQLLPSACQTVKLF